MTRADADSCDAVIASLPYFFGDRSGIEACAAAVRTQRGWVAERDGGVVGFLTVDEPFPGTAEITWMAVRAGHRRQGVGRLLIERAADESARAGARMLVVLTLGPSEPEPDVVDGYAGTREFYRRMGFTPVCEARPQSWNQMALVLVRALRPGRSRPDPVSSS